MAIYHFSSNIVSRGNGQSSIAKAAYNSASKIRDYKNEIDKDFTLKQCDYSDILLPDNAPVEFEDREYLWNKVEQVENRKDSQLAREIRLALPTELDNESNIELALNFAKSLTDEGMIVDINIHHLEEKNPHVHLLCTLRGIDENGNFEPKRIGNSKVRDWDSKAKNYEWRKRWEVIQNQYLERSGFKERVSSNSYSDNNIDLKATKKEGWKARKFEDETGIKSKVSKYNEEIRNQNQKKIDNKFRSVADKISKKENVLPYLNKEETIELKQLAKTLKLYVSPINIYKEQEKISDIKNKTLLLDPEKRDIKLNDLSSKEEQLKRITNIFEKRSNEFFNEHFPTEVNKFSQDEKIFITDEILNNKSEIPSADQLDLIVEDKRYLEAQISLNTILGKKDISIKSIDQEDKFFSSKIETIIKENNLSIKDIINNNYSHLEVAPKIDYYMNKVNELKKAKDIIDDYYSVQTKELFPINKEYNAFLKTSSAEEKEELINLKKFYGTDNTIKIIQNETLIPRFKNEELEEITHLIALIKSKELKENPTQFDKYFIQNTKEQLLDKYNINPDSSNDLKYISLEAEFTNNKESIKNLNYLNNNENEKSDNKKNDIAFIPLSPAQFTRLINSFSEIFKERMPKYINRSEKQADNTDTMSEKEKRKLNKSRNRGIGL